VLAGKLSEAWSQQVVVDNRPGAGSIVGAEIVAKAAPDGYTLLMGTNSLLTQPSLFKNLPYNVTRDFRACHACIACAAITVSASVARGKQT
jgi:tripartite-type tricarboxylate transporter receptor subunit TctC